MTTTPVEPRRQEAALAHVEAAGRGGRGDQQRNSAAGEHDAERRSVRLAASRNAPSVVAVDGLGDGGSAQSRSRTRSSSVRRSSSGRLDERSSSSSARTRPRAPSSPRPAARPRTTRARARAAQDRHLPASLHLLGDELERPPTVGRAVRLRSSSSRTSACSSGGSDGRGLRLGLRLRLRRAGAAIARHTRRRRRARAGRAGESSSDRDARARPGTTQPAARGGRRATGLSASSALSNGGRESSSGRRAAAIRRRPSSRCSLRSLEHGDTRRGRVELERRRRPGGTHGPIRQRSTYVVQRR